MRGEEHLRRCLLGGRSTIVHERIVKAGFDETKVRGEKKCRYAE